MVFLLENPGTCIVHNSICQMSSVWLWKLLNTCHSLTSLRVSLWLAPVLTTTWSMCHHLIGLRSDRYLVHALLFYWFTCLLLLGPRIDHYLVHVLPFNWRSCQIICQIIILNFVLTKGVKRSHLITQNVYNRSMRIKINYQSSHVRNQNKTTWKHWPTQIKC